MESSTNFEFTNDPSLILRDLGRPTRRGIKKCPKCGTYNGCRGMICKNKNCDAIFKDYADKRRISLDAVRLSNIVRHIYSVRVRDTGPDHRGFVQLPYFPLQNTNGNNNSNNTNNNNNNDNIDNDDSDLKNVLSENALCFVDSCQRIFDDSILKWHETNEQTSLLCVHIDSAINSHNIATPLHFKQEIFDLLQINDNMREKLWLLATEKEGTLVQRVSRTVMAVKCQVSPKHPLGYLHFTFSCSKGRETYDKYYCSCTEFMVSETSTNLQYKCVHYYACICALAGDPKYSEEFKYFISYEFPRDDHHLDTDKIPKIVKIEDKLTRNNANLKQIIERKTKCPNMKILKKYKTLAPKIFPVQIKVLEKGVEYGFKHQQTQQPSWDFLNWLSFITESINQTMQLENYGNLNTLHFPIPQIFFEEFFKRIPDIYKENQQNTYRIMNILHVKQIFDTVDVKLKISKRFIHENGEFIEEYEENNENEMKKSSFIFFLNVGQSTVDESDNTNNPFIIEWVPNITTITKIGQIKFQYKYGRKST